MRRMLLAFSISTLVVLGACSDSPLVEPNSPDSPSLNRTSPSDHGGPGMGWGDGITVMTQNLYVGADVDAVIAALASSDPSDDLPSLMAALETFQKTDFPARAAGIAHEIALARPEVIGLQEVSTIDVDLGPLGLPVSYHADFLPTLLDALARRGLHYAVAAQVKNISASPFPGISLIDYDVMLVDARRVRVQSKTEQNFSLNIGIVAPGVELKRGWVSVQARVGGKAFTFVSTHPESGQSPGLPELRAAQIAELMDSLGTGHGPTIIMGDLNDTPGSLMYQALTGGGFADLWATLRPGTRGFTCCEAPDLLNPRPTFDQRIDFIFTRGVGHGHRDRATITRVGDSPFERVVGPAGRIWPSDHAGLVARFPEPWSRW